MCITRTPSKKILLADIYDRHFKDYLSSKNRKLFILPKHLEAVNKAVACRSEKLGIAVFACKDCGQTYELARSCKHRFCARCGCADTQKWATKTLGRLLSMKHHHIIFTLPKGLRPLAKINGNLIYDLLFKISAEVLKSWFKHKHQLIPGIVSVLHTSGSDLKFHPHTHMIVTGGGRNLTSNTFRELDGDFLCPQQFLGRKMKIKFEKTLIRLFRSGKLTALSKNSNLTDFKAWLSRVNRKKWIVSIQKPLEDTLQIVGYVGRYTKRACLSEYKIIDHSDTIKFNFYDYKNTPRGEKPRVSIKSLSPHDFLDTLLQHVPDKRYRMVRYYGIYNSFYITKIPADLRGSNQQINDCDWEHFDVDFDWGEFEEFRKNMIKVGADDPLFCKDCNKNLILVFIKLKSKYINIEYENSS